MQDDFTQFRETFIVNGLKILDTMYIDKQKSMVSATTVSIFIKWPDSSVYTLSSSEITMKV